MLSRYLAAGVLTLAALALTGQARAQDVRLGSSGSTQAPTLNLKATTIDLGVDTVEVARGGFARGGGGFARGGGGFARGGGFYRGGYRGFAGYRGYRGFYGYRGYYGARYYPRYYYGARYYPRYYYGGYYPGYAYYPGAYYGATYYPSYYSLSVGAPCVGPAVIRPVPTMPPATALLTPEPSYTTPSVPAPPPAASVAPGTFPYDGGPRAPVPMPRIEERETRLPRGPALIDDLLVSMPDNAGKWNYPAYGEKPTRNTPTVAGPAVISGKLK